MLLILLQLELLGNHYCSYSIQWGTFWSSTQYGIPRCLGTLLIVLSLSTWKYSGLYLYYIGWPKLYWKGGAISTRTTG